MTSSEFAPPHPSPDELASVPLLATLSAAQLSSLAELLEVEDVSEGRVIVREGTAGYAFYFMVSGAAEVRHGDDVVRKLGPGDFFGEIAMIDKTRRTASVVAIEPCVVWSMFGTTFRVLEAEHPDIAQVLAEAANTRRD